MNNTSERQLQDVATNIADQDVLSFSAEGAKTLTCAICYGNNQDTRALLSINNLTVEVRQPVPQVMQRESCRLRR